MRSGTARWGDIEPHLARLTDQELRETIRDLCELSNANRTFLAARLLSPTERARRFAGLRRDFENLVCTGARAADLRQLVRAYVRASADHDGAALVLARHLRDLVKSMRESGLHRPPAGFTTLIGELGRLTTTVAEPDAVVRQELNALVADAGRVDEDVAVWISARIARSRS